MGNPSNCQDTPNVDMNEVVGNTQPTASQTQKDSQKEQEGMHGEWMVVKRRKRTAKDKGKSKDQRGKPQQENK